MTVLSLDEVKSHLNITDDAYDDELEGFVGAAEAIIAERVGPLEPTTLTSVIDAGGGRVILPTKPVISLTSVALLATGFTPGFSDGPANLFLNTSTGEVTSTTGYGLRSGRYQVTYVAGYETLPASLRLGVLEMTRHLWRSQRGGSSRPGSQTQDTAPTYLIPYYVQGLIEPHQKFRLGFI